MARRGLNSQLHPGRCPMCLAPIVAREDNPDARDPYVPATMWICERGCRVTEPDFTEVP